MQERGCGLDPDLMQLSFSVLVCFFLVNFMATVKCLVLVGMSSSYHITMSV